MQVFLKMADNGSMKTNIFIVLALTALVSCNSEKAAEAPEALASTEPPIDEVVVEPFEEKVLWFSVTPDKVYTHVGGRVHFKCWASRCEIIEASIYQYFINIQNVRHVEYGFGELTYWPEKNAYVGGMGKKDGTDGRGLIIKDGVPLMMTSQGECLLFGEASEDRFDFDQMITGKTKYSYNDNFLPYSYGIDDSSIDCDH